MSSDRKPICRLSIRTKEKAQYAIFTVWPGKFPGLYDINRDKASDKFPAMSLGEALRLWGSGEAYLQLSWESQRESRGGSPSPQRSQTNEEDELGF